MASTKPTEVGSNLTITVCDLPTPNSNSLGSTEILSSLETISETSRPSVPSFVISRKWVIEAPEITEPKSMIVRLKSTDGTPSTVREMGTATTGLLISFVSIIKVE